MLQKIDFQDIPNLAEHLSVIHFSQKECHYFNFASNIQNAPKAPISAITSSMPKVATRQDYNFCHTRVSWFSTLFHNSSDTICNKNNNFGFPKGFPTFWAKNENYYSLLLFTCHYSHVTIHWYYSPLLFTPKFCLFKGGCPLYSKQVFFMLSSGLLP